MVSSDEIKRRLEAKRRGETLSEEKKVDEATINCPECQTPNLPQAKFCVGCGKPLPKEVTPTVPTVQSTAGESIATSTPQKTETDQETDFKVCPSCNQKNKPNAKFCIICGHKFEQESGSEEGIAESESVTPNEDSTAQEEVQAPESEVLDSQGEVQAPVSEVLDSQGEVQEPKSEDQELEVVETEADETQGIPEIKVPQNLKSDQQKTVPESEPVEILETTESNEEPAQDVDPVEKIKKAKELLDIGAITQEEFDQIKNKYLEQI
jgi:hypothetical protein